MTLFKRTRRIETEDKIDDVTTYYEWEPAEILQYFVKLSFAGLGPIDTLLTSIKWSFHTWRLHFVYEKK